MDKGFKLSRKQDIISIIEACHRSNVSECTIGELVLKFHPLSPYTPTPQFSADTSVVRSEEMELVSDEVRRNAEHTKLMIEDPLAFEQLAIDAHMN
jgi:hypothetical protein